MTKKNISNRTFVITAAIGSALITVILILNTLWASRQTIKATDEAVSAVSSFYLNAMANRRARTITNLINNNFDQMEKAVDVIRDEEIETQEELRSSIGMIKSLLALSRFALVDEDNVVYTQYTTYTGGSRHEFLAEVLCRLGVPREVAEEDACKIEHDLSQTSFDRMRQWYSEHQDGE